MSDRTVCLCMIVKNEREVLARCLASVREHIDYWVICDTGSSDGTGDIAEEALREVPGELHCVPWQDFGHNRTQAIGLCRERADYTLMIDADMILNVKAPFKDRLIADAYLLQYEGELDYWQCMLFGNAHAWKFVGATHEYAFAETATVVAKHQDISLTHFGDGSNRGAKLERDLGLLLQAVAADPNDVRAMFYLAQTYRDMDAVEESLRWYRARVGAGGWAEEVWYSLYQIAQLEHARGGDWATALVAYLRAFEFRPSRLETLYEIVRHYRQEGSYAIAHLLATAAMCRPYPNDDVLFIERSVYTFRLAFELAVCCYYVGEHERAIEIYNALVDRDDLPADYQQLCLSNRQFSVERLRPAKAFEVLVEHRIRVVVLFYNAGEYLDNCIASLQAQDYPNFDAVFVNDASTDGCEQQVPLDDARFQLINNDLRQGGGRNLDLALATIEDPHTIVVFLDGDDWLACNDALSAINRCYNEQDCWVMYGQYRDTEGRHGIAKPYASKAAFLNAREVWYASAIRSFRAGLYQKALQQDPECSFLKNSRGEWYLSAMDMALMYPILELAGFERVHYNHRVLYIYNIDNPLNVHKVEREQELANNLEIIDKPRFAQVESYMP